MEHLLRTFLALLYPLRSHDTICFEATNFFLGPAPLKIPVCQDRFFGGSSLRIFFLRGVLFQWIDIFVDNFGCKMVFEICLVIKDCPEKSGTGPKTCH